MTARAGNPRPRPPEPLAEQTPGPLGPTPEPIPGPRTPAERVDEIMERASHALLGTRYFEAAGLAERGLRMSRASEDFDRMARCCLPLQEARRQIRQLAADAGPVRLIASAGDVPQRFAPGCYLLRPPLIGADARALRHAASRARVPAFILTREPMTRIGLWPVVGVGTTVVRTRVAPPAELGRVETSVTKDGFEGEIPMPWFVAAHEALGDAAIAALDPGVSPWHHVDDLLEAIEAIPDHEKLMQRLMTACREALRSPRPTEPRRDPLTDDRSF